MKFLKIPGLGRFGHYVDNVDFNTISKEEWLEIGKLNLKGLVTVLRNVTISKDQYPEGIKAFGPLESSLRSFLVKKYGHDFDASDEETYKEFSEEEKEFLRNKKSFFEKTEKGTTLTRITGKLDEHGNPMGVFGSGDLAWHSNESAYLTFAPCVSLLGGAHMTNSSTGFLQTVDYYESITDSFRSELDEMILIHTYHPGIIDKHEKEDLILERQVRLTMCPENGLETPLVVTSPGGYRGLRYPMHTASGIKGMSKEDSDRVFAELNKHLLDPKNIFDHWYEQDNDLLLFDNSVTQHRRIGGHPDRLCYRYQYFPKNLIDGIWQPYDDPYYAEEYNKIKTDIDQLREKTLGY
jgi:alpha-ketoglutarate-dependent taurine dioxygenase